RIHELAKDWNVSTKDVLVKIERLGIRNKKSQSSLSDEQIARVREALGLRDKASVAIGTERIVSERVVTERDASEEQMVTSREQVVENRVKANVIRRRTQRVEVLKREEIPLPSPEETSATEPAAIVDVEPEMDAIDVPFFAEESAPEPQAPETEPSMDATARVGAAVVEPAAAPAVSAPRLDDAPQTVRVLGKI